MISLRTFYQSPSGTTSLVLLHAFPLSSAMWEGAASVIARQSPDSSIILADFPGFGDAPSIKDWTLAAAMEDLHSKLTAEEILNPVIGGLSMGGYAAFAYYRLHLNELRALILTDTKPSADTEEGKKGREVFALDAEKRGAEAVYERMLPKLVSDSSKQRNPALFKTLKNWIASFSPEAIAAGLRALALRADSNDLLETIGCPTVVIAGENDAIIPSEEMKLFSEKIPDAQFVQIPDVGHLSALEDPEAWGEAVSKFLNRI
jgi:3-oxoadipate enol-lactonase